MNTWINRLALAWTVALTLATGSVQAQCEEWRTDVDRIFSWEQTSCMTNTDNILSQLQCSLDNRESNEIRSALIEEKVNEMLSSICTDPDYNIFKQELVSFYIEVANRWAITTEDYQEQMKVTSSAKLRIFSAEYDNSEN